MKSKLLYLFLLVLICTMTVMVGCTAGNNVGDAEKDSLSAEQKQPDLGEGSNKTESSISAPDYLNKSGYPIVKEKIKLKMMAPRNSLHGDWEKMDFFIKMEEKTNISFEFITPPSEGWEEKKNLAFASGELPDVFWGGLTVNDEMTYGSQGLLIPLEKLIAQYGPNLTRLFSSNVQYHKAVTTLDGHIYALPQINELFRDNLYALMWINNIWLKNLGLSIPKTTDEFYSILKAFKDQDPNKNGKKDEIPMTSLKLNDVRTFFFTAFGMLDKIFVENEDVVFAPMDDRYRECLKYVNKIYTEGLLDNETFTQTSQQITAKGNDGRLGVFMNTGAPYLYVKKENNGDYTAIPPLTSPTSDKQIWSKRPGVLRGQFAITNINKYPEATMRWVDQFYSAEGGHNLLFGNEGVGWEWTDDTKTKFRRIQPENVNPEEYRHKITPGWGPFYRSLELARKRDDVYVNYSDSQAERAYMEYAQVPFPLTYFTNEEQKRLATLQTDIDTYVLQMEAKFVMGTESIEKWNDYVDTLKKMGVDELISIYRTAYDRWKTLK